MTTVITPSRPAHPIRVDSGGRIPAGGTTGQALVKSSDNDYATAWGTATASAAWGAITGTLASQTDLAAALAAKQDTLVSGTNIKTLNGSTILGSGDLVISASVADGDKGDITVSASGATWTIDNGAVTVSKMANMATASLIYRKTAGSGAPEVNTLATLKTDLGLTGTNSGDQTITLTSDVTGSGTGSFATTIANNAVTLAKMQDFTTDVLLGRDTAGSGDPELIGVGGGVEFNGAGSIRTSAFTGDVTKTAGGTALTIAADAVTNTQLANMAANTVKVRAAATSGDPSDLALAASQLLGRGASGDIAPIVLGTNLSMTGTTLNAAGGGGGGGATGGSATLDFGAAPGSSLAEVVVTGQTGLLSGSRIRVWVQGSTTDHNAYEHSRILPGRLGLGTADVVAGTGFTICAETELRLTGEVAVNWEWA